VTSQTRMFGYRLRSRASGLRRRCSGSRWNAKLGAKYQRAISSKSCERADQKDQVRSSYFSRYPFARTALAIGTLNRSGRCASSAKVKIPGISERHDMSAAGTLRSRGLALAEFWIACR